MNSCIQLVQYSVATSHVYYLFQENSQLKYGPSAKSAQGAKNKLGNDVKTQVSPEIA